jgi:hypothetical protein
MLYVESYANRKKIPSEALVIDTTSHSTTFSKGLSPFVLPGGHLYGEYYAENVENAWQASKVYSEFLDMKGEPTSAYFAWANDIWKSKYAFRYPMGKGRVPAYSYWDGKKLTYVEARKAIYIPIYGRALIQSPSFKQLLEIYNAETRDIYLIDFDGYNHIKMGKSLLKVIEDPLMKMGHAFIVYGMLEKYKNKP